jgi:hypothetical protein
MSVIVIALVSAVDDIEVSAGDGADEDEGLLLSVVHAAPISVSDAATANVVQSLRVVIPSLLVEGLCREDPTCPP